MMLYQSHLNGRAYLMIITGEDLMKFSPPDGYEVAKDALRLYGAKLFQVLEKTPEEE